VAAVSQLEVNGVPVYINPAIGPSGTVHAQRLGIALECIVVDSLETFTALKGASADAMLAQLQMLKVNKMRFKTTAKRSNLT
jgi:hypothetical protein